MSAYTIEVFFLRSWMPYQAAPEPLVFPTHEEAFDFLGGLFREFLEHGVDFDPKAYRVMPYEPTL